MITLRATSPGFPASQSAPKVAGGAVSASSTAEFFSHPFDRSAITPRAPAAFASVRVATRNFYLRYSTC